jgi:hypothetical protein
MKTMTTHVSAISLEQTPHKIETEASNTNTSTNITISNALKRRAQSVINDTSIDPRWRAIVRYGLETNDPWLADLVRRVDAGEPIIDTVEFSLEPNFSEDESREEEPSEEKIEALAEIICRAGDECAAALFVLMGTLENSGHPKLLANMAKHSAFTRCGESNLYGIVDAQIGVVEAELLATAN